MGLPFIVGVGAMVGDVGAVTPAFPAGIVTNDILVLALTGTDPDVGFPAIANAGGGTWTQIGGYDAGPTHRTAYWWSRYNGSQTAPTSTDTGDHNAGVIFAIRDCPTTGSPVDVVANAVSTFNETTSSCPTVTTTSANCLVVAAISLDGPDWDGTNNFSNWTNANLASLTEWLDQSSSAGVGCTLGFAAGGKAAAGATGATTNDHASQRSGTRHMAFLPGPGAPTLGVLAATLADISLVTAGVVTGGVPILPTVVAVGTPWSGIDAVTIPFPPGIQTGDILLLAIEAKAPDANFPAIANAGGGTWTEIATDAGDAHRTTYWWSRYDGVQTAPTTNDTGDHQLGVIVALRGCLPSGSPINATASGASIFNAGALSLATITTTVDQCLIVSFVTLDGPDWDGTANCSNWANPNLANIIELLDQSTSAGVGGTIALMAASKTTAGAIGGTTVNHPSQLSLNRVMAFASPGGLPGGSLSQTLEPVGLVATGTVTGGGGGILGNLNKTLDAVTVVATGTAIGGSGGALPLYIGAGAPAESLDPITPALPAGLLVNDILLLAIQTSIGTIGVANGAGGTWTQIGQFAPSNSGVRLTVLFSRYNGSQGAPTTTDSGDHQLGVIIAIRGCHTTEIPLEAGAAPTFAEVTSAIGAVTTAAANSLIIDFIAAEGVTAFSAWTNAALANLTERVDVSTALGLTGTLGIATGGKVSAGSTGTTSVTHANTRVAYQKIALAPVPGTSTALSWSVDNKGRVLKNNQPMLVRLFYSTGLTGAGGSQDMAGEVANRNLGRWANKINFIINNQSGTFENILRMCDAILPFNMYMIGNANVFSQWEPSPNLDLLANPNNFRQRFADKPNAGGVYIADEPTDSVLQPAIVNNNIIEASIPQLPRLQVLFQDPKGQMPVWATQCHTTWLSADPYPIGAAPELHPDGATTTSTYGYMNFTVGEAAALTRLWALRTGQAPILVAAFFKMGNTSRWPLMDEHWSYMVAGIAEGCHMGWWAHGVQMGAIDERPWRAYTGDGVLTTFETSTSVEHAEDVEVKYNNAVQNPSTYTVNNIGDRAIVKVGNFWQFVNPGSVTMNTPPANGVSVVVTSSSWPVNKKTAALDMLDRMTALLSDYEATILRDPSPQMLTLNSTSNGNPLLWRRNYCTYLTTSGALWWFGYGQSYAEELSRLNQTPPNTTLSDHMLDQSGNVRTRCFVSADGTYALVFGYNLHPDAQSNVSLQWANTVLRVEVLDEARDVALQPDNRTWIDTFGGSSSLRQGFRRQGHVYKLTLSAAPPPSAPGTPTITSLGAVSTTAVNVGLGAGSGAVTHALYRGTATGFTRDAAHLIASFGVTPTPVYLDSGLTPSTQYFYRLAATNTGGTTESVEINITTLAASTNDAALFWGVADRAFIPWPGHLVEAKAGAYEIAFVGQPGSVQTVINKYQAILDAPDATETLHDVAIAAPTGTRLAPVTDFRVIQSVSLTLIDDGAVPPNVAVTARVIDKDAALGPLIRCYNSVATVVAGHVDAIITGY